MTALDRCLQTTTRQLARSTTTRHPPRLPALCGCRDANCGPSVLQNTTQAAPRRRILSTRPRALGNDASSFSITQLAERSQETLRSVYIKALPGPLAWAPSYLVPLTACLSVLGAVRGHELLHFLDSLQAPAWFPMASSLQAGYSQNPQAWDVAFDTILSLPCALFIFVALPALDLLLGMDPKTPEQTLGRQGVYRGMLHAHVGLYWAMLCFAASSVSEADLHPLTLLGLMASVGCSGGQIFTVAHELLHSPRKVDKTAASLSLMPLAYMHWVPSHIAHHCNVGKFEDATTARLGEPLYHYLPRTVLGNIKDGVHIELGRLRAKRLPLFSLHNRVFQWAAGPLGLLTASYNLWGPQAAALGIGQALIAILMLESVNYVEHYGLVRRQLPSGKYERTTIFHSWNANWIFTNSIVFSVQRHSDHHAHAYKPYQGLEEVDEAPQLPASYPVMMLLALLPGIFFDIMDPRALEVARQRSSQKHNS